MNLPLKPWRRWWVILPSVASRRLFVVLLALLAVGVAPAQTRIPVPQYEENPFVEQEAALPAYPSAGGLVEFPIDGTMRVLIDRASLQVGGDQVVRYTLVVRSPSGAETISREGMRCSKPEFRVYAYGRKAAEGGAWSAARNSEWRPLAGSDARLRLELRRDVFCDGVVPESATRMLGWLARGGRPVR